MQAKLTNKLLIASNNSGKVKEFHQLLAALENVTLVTPIELGISLTVEESGSSYLENARLKAEAFSEASGLIALGDDSGLEVDALDGAPGLYSARYSARPGADDADRRRYLLDNLSGKPRPWTARFQASLVIAIPGEQTRPEFAGVCEGEIIPTERGVNGFGYDPIFFIPAEEYTMAQLSDQKKNLISHRGRAVAAALPALKALFAGKR
ncbi:MAG: RdgB/HAM1 family non-canonical purine NTP pyrophosphatase [Chloroflexota bacterium]